jgi:mono/diheme cytochrome c family protein
MKNCSLPWAIAGLFIVLCLGLLYKFLIQGSTVTASDKRTAIVLEAGERDLVLAEMRAFLVSVQQITLGVAAHDPAAIARAARASGMGAAGAVPASLMGKLPLEFKTLGLSTHEAFDQLALNVEDLQDPTQALEQLATLLGNCVACHAAYSIVIE